MADYNPQKKKASNQSEPVETQSDHDPVGDQVGGDKIEVGNIKSGTVAIGDHAQVIITKTYITADETPGIWVGVPSMPAIFVGRDDLIQGMIKKLTEGTSLALSAEGLPGVGKTAMAVALAYHREVLKRFKDGVLWAGLGPQGSTMNALAAWGKELGLDISGLVTEAERKRAVQNAIGQRQLLLVIDDVWESSAANVLRCGGPNCCHLLTTRDRGIAKNFAGANRSQNITTLDDDPAFELLYQLAPEACRADPKTAQVLARAVDGLPLALELLGGYLNDADHPERAASAEVFSDLGQATLKKLTDPNRRLQLACERLGTPGIEVTLQQTIALSLESLSNHDRGQEAKRAFYALGAFAPKPTLFSRQAAEYITESDGQVLALLVARNLLEVQDGKLTLHQSLDDVAQTQVNEMAITRHRHYYMALVNKDRENWKQIESIYRQVQKAWQSLQEDKEYVEMLEMVGAIRVYQERRGLWRDQLEWAQRGLELTKAKGWREDEASLLNNIGLVYKTIGKVDKAENYHREALLIAEELENPFEIARYKGDLGSVFYWQSKNDESRDFYEEAISILSKISDQEDGESRRKLKGVLLGRLGSACRALGEIRRGKICHEEALAIASDLNDRQEEGKQLSRLGNSFERLGQYEDAIKHYELSRTIARDIGDLKLEGSVMSSLGFVHRSLGNIEKSIDSYRKALELARVTGYRRGRGSRKGALGSTYRAVAKFDEAFELFEEAMAIAKEVKNKREIGVQSSNIGDVYCDRGEFEVAKKQYTDALKIAEETNYLLGKERNLSNLGNVFRLEEKNERALEFYYAAIDLALSSGDTRGEGFQLLGLGQISLAIEDIDKVNKYSRKALAIGMPETRYGAALVLGISLLHHGLHREAKTAFHNSQIHCLDQIRRTKDLYKPQYFLALSLKGKGGCAKLANEDQKAGLYFECAIKQFERAKQIFSGEGMILDVLWHEKMIHKSIDEDYSIPTFENAL